MSSDRSLTDILLAVEARTARVNADLADMKKDLSSVNVTLAVQATQLEIHMKRSETNEQAVMELRKQNLMIQGVGVFLGMLGVVATIYAAVK